ncbi:hypothetical protein SDC9_97763 [bioreactor metagenome]|uniref:Uncharacterized protein n=1 Tax=bioreactor metagenome TaxID=1076179 RepID=A0A645ADB6_9ZZZZ
MGIRHVEHPLPHGGKAMEPLPIFDGNIVIKCVYIRSSDGRQPLRIAFLKISPYANIAICHMKQGFILKKFFRNQSRTLYIHPQNSLYFWQFFFCVAMSPRLFLDSAADHTGDDLPLEEQYDKQCRNDDHHCGSGNLAPQDTELGA